MNEYELVMIFSPESSEEDVNSTIDRVTKSAAEDGGELVQKESWGLRRLAHPVHGVKEGTYMSAYLKMEQKSTYKVEKSMTGAPGLIRHLLLKKN